MPANPGSISTISHPFDGNAEDGKLAMYAAQFARGVNFLARVVIKHVLKLLPNPDDASDEDVFRKAMKLLASGGCVPVIDVVLAPMVALVWDRATNTKAFYKPKDPNKDYLKSKITTTEVKSPAHGKSVRFQKWLKRMGGKMNKWPTIGAFHAKNEADVSLHLAIHLLGPCAVATNSILAGRRKRVKGNGVPYIRIEGQVTAFDLWR